MPQFSSKSSAAFTLFQVVVVVAIIATLAALIIPSFGKIVAKSGRAKCANNLRQLHVAFSAYQQDIGHWPQIPKSSTESEKAYQDWWMKTMEPYGASENIWQCPVMSKVKVTDQSGGQILMHYIPTQFDAGPMTPTRWAGQPWMIERGNAHGDGALILFPDGSVQSLNQILKNR